jgi:integrase
MSRREGLVFRDTYLDKSSGERHECKTWTARYYANGRYFKKSGFETETAARKFLRDVLVSKDRGELVPSAGRVTFQDLSDLLVLHYENNKRKSLDRAKRALAHLMETFGSYKATAITTEEIEKYKNARLKDGAANATVNRELAVLKKAFNLAVRTGKLARRPVIDLLAVSNARKGFLEEEQYRSILAHLPEYARPVLTAAYWTGWRVPSEVLPLEWRQVDLAVGTLRLDPGTTKNDDGRVVYATHELLAVLRAQKATTEAFQKKSGKIVPWVFHKNGKPIRSIRRVWNTAAKAAGCPGLIPHDLRRSAVRNLERAGVSRSVAMKITGHKTESVYRRYAIVSDGDLKTAASKLAALSTQSGSSTVKAIR